MKTLKEMFYLIVNILSKPFYFIASLASLFGFAFVFISDADKVLFSFIFFNFLLLILLGALVYTILKIINTTTDEFESKSTFIKYETVDGNKITYEVYKVIQSKRPIITDYTYNFKWTGTHLPTITSNLQEVVNIYEDKNPSCYDRAILKFKSPLKYNESTVLHFKADLDDADKQSDTYVSNRILKAVDVIHIRIILKYKLQDTNGILERKKIDSVSQSFVKIKEIAFDLTSKSYEYHLLNPEVGYIYRIRWDR